MNQSDTVLASVRTVQGCGKLKKKKPHTPCNVTDSVKTITCKRKETETGWREGVVYGSFTTLDPMLF